jgi:hypothetical protein
LWIFYVFSELDTFDYMMKRYEVGALTKEQAKRAISHLQNRCINLDGFREDASWCIENGAYDATVREAIRYVLEQTDARDRARADGALA